ncbi:MAG: metalloregulator ArsR/SmtB family transcription factor [Phototrophicaceae bacterium]
MNTDQQQDLLTMLKTLADDNRLRLIGLVAEREWTVSELADALQLAESTVSYHVSRLHGVGLLRLRMAGTYRHYRLNEQRVAKLKAYIAEIDQPVIQPERVEVDDSWIETLTVDEADKKVLRAYMQNGRLVRIPSKDKKWLVILNWLASHFEPDRRYTEKQVNEILLAVHDDYATLRRDLISYGYMRRERGGGDYWLVPENEAAN